jgi:hypothetical protein
VLRGSLLSKHEREGEDTQQGRGRTSPVHGCHAQGRCRPLRQSSEEMVGNGVADVGANFGPFSG